MNNIKFNWIICLYNMRLEFDNFYIPSPETEKLKIKNYVCGVLVLKYSL